MSLFHPNPSNFRLRINFYFYENSRTEFIPICAKYFRFMNTKSNRWRVYSSHSDTLIETNLTDSYIGQIVRSHSHSSTAKANYIYVQPKHKSLIEIVMADKDKAHLGCLEEDDEFEEFPAEGELFCAIQFNLDGILFATMCVCLHRKSFVVSRMDWQQRGRRRCKCLGRQLG